MNHPTTNPPRDLADDTQPPTPKKAPPSRQRGPIEEPIDEPMDEPVDEPNETPTIEAPTDPDVEERGEVKLT